MKTQLYLETMRIASSIDNLLFDDTIDLFNSTAVERLCRRLYRVEIALKDVTNQNHLSKVDRSISDAAAAEATSESDAEQSQCAGSGNVHRLILGAVADQTVDVGKAVITKPQEVDHLGHVLVHADAKGA